MNRTQKSSKRLKILYFIKIRITFGVEKCLQTVKKEKGRDLNTKNVISKRIEPKRPDEVFERFCLRSFIFYRKIFKQTKFF
jgi:hypothetical protein